MIAFIIEQSEISLALCLGCVSIVPLCFFIGIAIGTGVITGCQTMMKTWLITDCIVFAFSQFYFFFIALYMAIKKRD